MFFICAKTGKETKSYSKLNYFYSEKVHDTCLACLVFIIVMEANKFSKLSVKDFIKESPGGPRLQSLRLPRDLSLGGSKLPKKIYKPNVNVARNKDKPKEFVKKDKEFKGKRNNDLHNTRKQKFVQSSGIFSDGMGDGHRLTEKRVVNHSRDIEKPVLKLNRTSDKTSSSLLPDKKADMELSDCLLKYEEDEDDDSKESDNSGPVNWNSLDLTKKPIKTELKEEAAVASSIFCDKNSREISNSNPTMTLWRLPSCLAIKNTVEKKLVNCTLTDLPEGKIGKVCIRRSGKVDVYIGNTRYELMPEFESHTGEVVAINPESGSEKPTAAVLSSKMENYFQLKPSFESLLR